jgi:hypothetical protein
MYYNDRKSFIGGSMAKLGEGRGLGVIEWILVIILVVMVLITAYLLLEPALLLLWDSMLQSIQQ